MEYNGWKNHATWEAGLEIMNSEPTYQMAVGAKSASELEERFGNWFPSSEIDWNEIFEGLRG